MYSHERKSKIVDLLEAHSSVNVNVLAETLCTSKETIRRDLKELEADGVLKRTHGGAVFTPDSHHIGPTAPYTDAASSNEYPFATRHVRNIPEKKLIAQKAASLIQDKDTIFIDNSTTTLFLLDYIPRDYSLTIITNSIKVLLETSKSDNPNLSPIALAGFYNRSNYSVYGTRALKSAEDFFPDKAFISCTGVTSQLTDINLNEIDTKKAMMQKSKETFLLIDHTKFGSNGPFYLSGFDAVDYIITDNYNHSPETAASIRAIEENNNLQIITN